MQNNKAGINSFSIKSPIAMIAKNIDINVKIILPTKYNKHFILCIT